MMILLIFDVDGTLVYSRDRQDSKCFAGAYEEIFSMPFPSIDWRLYPHVTDTTIFNTVFQEHFHRNPSEEEADRLQRRYIELLKKQRKEKPEDFREVPGARLAIERLLREEELVVSIATGGWAEPARLKLDHVGIPSRSFLVKGADGKVTREAIIREVIRESEVDYGAFGKIVYIGDAIWDVVTTRRLNLNFVGVRYRNEKDLLERAGAARVIDDFRNFPVFLQAVRHAEPPRRIEEENKEDE